MPLLPWKSRTTLVCYRKARPKKRMICTTERRQGRVVCYLWWMAGKCLLPRKEGLRYITSTYAEEKQDKLCYCRGKSEYVDMLQLREGRQTNLCCVRWKSGESSVLLPRESNYFLMLLCYFGEMEEDAAMLLWRKEGNSGNVDSKEKQVRPVCY